MLLDVLLDETLPIHLVDDTLSISKKGSHCCVDDGEVDELIESKVFDAERCT